MDGLIPRFCSDPLQRTQAADPHLSTMYLEVTRARHATTARSKAAGQKHWSMPSAEVLGA